MIKHTVAQKKATAQPKKSTTEVRQTEVVALLSHQLRTPLSTISWYVEALLTEDRGKLNEKQTEYLEEVYRANKSMVDLVTTLLIKSEAKQDRHHQ